MKCSFRRFKMAPVLALPIFVLSLLLPVCAFALTPSGTGINNFATTTYYDTNNNLYTIQSNTVTVTVSAVYKVTAFCTADQSAYLGTTVNYACYIQNTGNANNNFTLSAAFTSTSCPGWGTPQLYVDSNNNDQRDAGESTPTTGVANLAPDAMYKFFVTVQIPGVGTGTNGATSQVTLTVTGEKDTTSDDTTVPRTTTALAPTISVVKKVRVWPNGTFSGGAFALSGTAKPGDALEYQVQISNTGSLVANKMVLFDPLDTNVTYVPGSLWAGGDPGGSAAPNLHRGDGTSDDAGSCGSDSCAMGSYDGGQKKVFFYIGSGATEALGGTLGGSQMVYLYYRVLIK